MVVKINLEHEMSKIPHKANISAACYDVYAADIHYNKDSVIVDLGFSTEFNKDWVGRIMPRSNLSKYRWAILNSPANIDSDYRGTWKVVFTPMLTEVAYGDDPSEFEYPSFPYTIGDRVAQISFERVNEVEWEVTSHLSETVRGAGGFGSTGLK